MQEKLPEIRRNRKMWSFVAIVVLLAFFMIWTLGFFGTPARESIMPDATEGVPVVPGTLDTQP